MAILIPLTPRMQYFYHLSEAAKKLLWFGFEELKLHRIYATCNTENYGSYRVMEKCGMRKEAHFRKNRYGRVSDQEQWYDEYYYAILKEDWDKDSFLNNGSQVR